MFKFWENVKIIRDFWSGFGENEKINVVDTEVF